MLAIGIYLGVGIGMVLVDAMECGLPQEWRQWLDWSVCPLLWPIAVYRRMK